MAVVFRGGTQKLPLAIACCSANPKWWELSFLGLVHPSGKSVAGKAPSAPGLLQGITAGGRQWCHSKPMVRVISRDWAYVALFFQELVSPVTDPRIA